VGIQKHVYSTFEYIIQRLIRLLQGKIENWKIEIDL
jgi:hypothetical protein